MGRHPGKGRSPLALPGRQRFPRRWRLAVSALFVLALAAGAFWFGTERSDSSGGTPRLIVDRREIDLGVLPFDAPTRVTFVLTNVGDGPLTIKGSPRVEAIQGC